MPHCFLDTLLDEMVSSEILGPCLKGTVYTALTRNRKHLPMLSSVDESAAAVTPVPKQPVPKQPVSCVLCPDRRSTHRGKGAFFLPII